MKNIIKLKAMLRIAGIIALAALIGFSMAACPGPDGPTGGTGGTGGTGSGGGRGTLTVTGLPQGDWGVVGVFPAGTDLSSMDAILALQDGLFNGAETVSGNHVSGGQNNNVFSLWDIVGYTGYYSASGRKEVLLINDYNFDYYYYYATVNFSNGSATVPWSSFTRVAW
jgi:hypothetical protein